MEVRELEPENHRRYVVILDEGDEIVASLSRFAEEHAVKACSIMGLGGLQHATLAYYDRARREYDPIPIAEQVELLSLNGNITQFEGKPKVHVHAAIGKRDGTAHGGHVLDAHVWPTVEIVLEELPGEIFRKMNEACGLPLIHL